MKRFIQLLCSIALVSCSAELATDEQQTDVEYGFRESLTEFSASVEPIVDARDSKTYISPDNQFSWVVGDKIGFWPDDADVLYGQAAQVVFHVSESFGATANFKGNGWGIARGTTYHSYYPYDPLATQHSVSINYSGQNPEDTGTTGHLGEYDYLYSTSAVPATGAYTIEYQRIGTIARFLITIPQEYTAKRFVSLKLLSSESLFVKSAQYDPSCDPIDFSNKVFSSDFELQLGGADGIVCNENNQLEIFAMMFPTAWAGRDINLVLVDSETNYYVGTFRPKSDQQPNKRLLYKVENLQAVIETDLSELTTANSYIVSAAGLYKFKAVQGNTLTPVNFNGLKVLWESVNTSVAPAPGTLIEPEVSFKNGYIRFKTNDTFQKGNAVIAAYSDANCTDGNVLWSWHIWFTDAPDIHQYYNEAGYMMDRNLGALDTTGDLSAGLFYQWGRKDPFLGTASISSCVAMAATKSFGNVSRNSTNGTVAWATANPTTFIHLNGSPLDWMYTANPTLWYNADSTKTKYDPCPPGYKVARGSSTANTEAGRGFWAKALGINWRVTSSTSTYSTPVGNVVFSNNVMSFPRMNGVAYYPAAGCLTDSGGTLQYVGKVMVWSDYPAGSDDNKNWNTQYSGVLDFNHSAHSLTVNWNSGRAAGKSVRCMVESSSNQSFSANENFATPVVHEW